MKKLTLIAMIIGFALVAQAGNNSKLKDKIDARNEQRKKDAEREKQEKLNKIIAKKPKQDMEREWITLNIRHKGKIYKDFICQVVWVNRNKALIWTQKGQRLTVEVGKSSLPKAKKTTLNFSQAKAEREVKQREFEANTIKVSRIEMFQNLTPRGCLVYLWVQIKTTRNGQPFLDYKKELAYLTNNFEVADGEAIFGSQDELKHLKKKGLHRYATANNASNTIRKYSLPDQ